MNDGALGNIGPALFDLEFGGMTFYNGMAFGSFGGSGTLSADQITDLDAGNLYVNLAVSAHPNGEIRGEIVPVPEPLLLASIAAAWLVALTIKNQINQSFSRLTD